MYNTGELTDWSKREGEGCAIANGAETASLLTRDDTQHKIYTLEPDKRQRILDAAMTEFEKGYRRASTDAICKQAGIAKGLLFFYFGTKKELFFFLMRRAAAGVVRAYTDVSLESRDYLENLWNISLKAVQLSLSGNADIRFLMGAYFSAKQEFADELLGMESPLDGLMRQMMARADRSLFREDIDVDKALQVIYWSVQGYSAELGRRGHSAADYETTYEEIEREFAAYLAFLRGMFYK